MTVQLYHGDCLDVLRTLPDASVDAVIADPPYSSGGMFRGDRMQDVHAKYVQSDSKSGHALGVFGGDTRDQRAYGYWCALWLSECLRIVKPGGIGAVFADWRQLPTTTDALQAGGWVWRGLVAWHKPSARPTQGRWANACEYVVWGTNGPRPLAGRAYPGWYSYASPPGKARTHITEKPVALMRDLLAVVPVGGVVLDPFMGSGTTGVACVQEGRRFIGIEKEAGYFAIAEQRIATAQPPLPMAAD